MDELFSTSCSSTWTQSQLSSPMIGQVISWWASLANTSTCIITCLRTTIMSSLMTTSRPHRLLQAATWVIARTINRHLTQRIIMAITRPDHAKTQASLKLLWTSLTCHPSSRLEASHRLVVFMDRVSHSIRRYLERGIQQRRCHRHKLVIMKDRLHQAKRLITQGKAITTSSSESAMVAKSTRAHLPLRCSPQSACKRSMSISPSIRQQIRPT